MSLNQQQIPNFNTLASLCSCTGRFLSYLVETPWRQFVLFQVRLYIGIYFIHLQDWFRVFPRDQVFVIQLEDYTNHRTETVRKLYDFLDLSMTLSGPKYDTRWT